MVHKKIALFYRGGWSRPTLFWSVGHHTFAIAFFRLNLPPSHLLEFLTWKLVERRHSFGKEYNQRTMKTWRLGKGLQLNGREVGTALPPLVVGPCCPFTIAPSPVSLQPRFSFTTMEASLSPKIDAGSLLKISLVGGTHLLLHLLVVYPTWAKHCQLPMEGS